MFQCIQVIAGIGINLALGLKTSVPVEKGRWPLQEGRAPIPTPLPSPVDATSPPHPHLASVTRACLPRVFSRSLLFLGRRDGEKTAKKGFEGRSHVASGSGCYVKEQLSKPGSLHPGQMVCGPGAGPTLCPCSPTPGENYHPAASQQPVVGV